MLVYGKNVAREILKSNITINKVYLTEEFNNEELLSLIEKRKLEVNRNKKNILDKMIDEPHQGIILEIEDYKYYSLDDIKKDESASFIVILDHLEDPRNFGAIIRTCECAGVDYIIIPNKRSVDITNVVVKTSSGALFNSKICEVSNLRNTIEILKKIGFWIIGTDADGDAYDKIDYSGKTVLVIGSEGNGLQKIVRDSCDTIASIPLKGKVNSLNASVAAGIVIYEVVKTR